ncbi:MAG: hypothetical protein ACE5J2_08370 [Nitrososphaerales archaeon]
MSEDTGCKGRLVVTSDGSWKFELDPTSECAEALEDLIKDLGPMGKCYVGAHIEPADKNQSELVRKARESC